MKKKRKNHEIVYKKHKKIKKSKKKNNLKKKKRKRDIGIKDKNTRKVDVGIFGRYSDEHLEDIEIETSKGVSLDSFGG